MRRTIHASRPTSRVPHGFTLMELLVVLTLFSTVVVAATDIFLLVNRSQRKIFGFERAQADARYTVEAIAREARNDLIDYAYYAARVGKPLAVPDTELALIDGSGSKIKFHESDAATGALCPDAQSTPCLLVTVDANPPAPITPKGEVVRGVRFYVAPVVDPMAFDPASGAYASNEQPRVTIVLSLESSVERIEERSLVFLQTTVTSRSYRR